MYNEFLQRIEKLDIHIPGELNRRREILKKGQSSFYPKYPGIITVVFAAIALIHFLLFGSMTGFNPVVFIFGLLGFISLMITGGTSMVYFDSQKDFKKDQKIPGFNITQQLHDEIIKHNQGLFTVSQMIRHQYSLSCGNPNPEFFKMMGKVVKKMENNHAVLTKIANQYELLSKDSRKMYADFRNVVINDLSLGKELNPMLLDDFEIVREQIETELLVPELIDVMESTEFVTSKNYHDENLKLIS